MLTLLAVGEVAVRIARPRLNEFTYVQPAGKSLPNVVEDPELFWLPDSWKWSDKMKQARAAAGRLLIYSFGGSIAKGDASRVNYSDLLEDRLNRQGVPARVVNFGVGGYTSFQSRVMCGRACREQAPDIVLFCNAYNDSLSLVYFTDRQAAARNLAWQARLLHAFNHSKLFCAYRTLLLPRPGRRPSPVISVVPAPIVPRVPLADYRQNLLDVAALARRHHFALVLVSQSVPTREYDTILAGYAQIMREVAATQPGVYYADVRARFDEYRRQHAIDYVEDSRRNFGELWSDDFCHPNERGHGLYAEAVYQTLMANQLVK